MLFFHLPAMVLALVPIIVVEWIVARMEIAMPRGKALKGVIAANCFSALLGFPLFSLICVVLLAATGRWLPNFPNMLGWVTMIAEGMLVVGPEQDVMMVVPLGTAMLIPAFFVSVFSERWVLRALWPEVQIPALSRFTWIAHLVSYPVLVVVWLFYMHSIKL